MTGAVGALSGPWHGGAPSRALDTLDAIGSPDDVDDWVRPRIEAGEKMMGFGHPVYRTHDPRSVMLRGIAESIGGDIVDFAKQVETRIVEILNEVKPGREIYTNVEFYAGVVMELSGLPRSMFTPTFASSRVIGWCANILEQAAHNKIIRPAARYVGPPPPQPVPALEDRGVGVSVSEATEVGLDLISAFGPARSRSYRRRHPRPTPTSWPPSSPSPASPSSSPAATTKGSSSAR